MNEVRAYPQPVPGGQYKIMLQLAHEAEASPILTKGGKPVICGSKEEAYRLITDHLLRYLRGNLVRDGEIAGHTANEANSVFQAPIRIQPKTRLITVSYKGRKVRARS